jgi:type III restriction enzyme
MTFQLLNLLDSIQEGEDRFSEPLSEYVVENLNPRFEIRDYQTEALNRLNYYLNTYKKRIKPSHLLFQMATGSGKTLVMAGCILQLYKQGYSNFIFFVNSTNIIEKTQDNFLNPASGKYLFDNEIKFEGKTIPIKQVENFANVDQDCINIHFTTIQTLHIRLNKPKENTLTYEDFVDRKMVLLSDEAHHMNVDTLRKAGKQLSLTEFEEYDSWEGTALRIFRSNRENILLEFTATAELHEQAIADKYNDKLIYDYSLKKFYLAKYSKEVNVLQASMTPLQRAIQATILSQYRLLVFSKYNLNIKPVVMFKSNLVNVPKKRDENKIVSSEFKEIFLEKMANLAVNDIEIIKDNASENGIIKKAFDFFEANGTTLENLVLQLQSAFSEATSISVDSISEKQNTQLVINSLEEPDNAIRAIFAVDALNEGWDVLNLFDIVRLYNTRDAKNGIPGKATMSEAQLIGRGARYFPFIVREGQEKYKRKFDQDLSSPLRICEELYFHSETNSRYIDELNKALDVIGIKPSNIVKREHTLKPGFKESEFYKYGIICLNELRRERNEAVSSFPDYLKNRLFYYKAKTGESSEATLLREKDVNQVREATVPYKIKVMDLGMSVLRTATQSLPFYAFSNIRRHFPNVGSIGNLIMAKEYLGSNEIEVTGNTLSISQLTQDDKLECAIKILNELQREIEKGRIDHTGTYEFKAIAIQNIFRDKQMNFVLSESGDSEAGYPMSSPKIGSHYLDLSKEDWYPFQDNYGTSEEKKLVLFIKAAVSKLQKKYRDIYLLRNEGYFQIYRFIDGRAFEPDFVLFLKEKKAKEAVTYQLFIEPKGEVFASNDQWKEDFLLDIEDKHIIYQSKDYKLIGLPFFNSNGDMQRKFSQVVDKFLPQS